MKPRIKKLRNFILFVIASVLVIYIAVIFITSSVVGNRLFKVFFKENKERKTQFTKLVELEGSRQNALSRDYTYWDDMVEFTKTGNTEFAIANIDPALDIFKVQGAWVYNMESKEIYKAGDLAIDRSPEIVFADETFDKLLKDRFVHYFLISGGDTVEIRAATIHPTSDPEHNKTDPQGFFFVARKWDSSTLGTLGNLSGGSAMLSDNDQTPTEEQLRSRQTTEITFSLPLLGLDGQSVKHVTIVAPNDLAKGVVDLLIIILYTSLGFGLLAAFVMVFVAERKVSRPFNKISKAVVYQDPEALEDLRKNPSEFGRIADLIVRFFALSSQLDQARAGLEEVVEDLGSAVITIDKNWIITIWNKTASQLTGISKEQAIGHSFKEKVQLLDANMRQPNYSFIQDALSSGHVKTVETGMILVSGGADRPVSAIAGPLKTQTGELGGAVISIQDIAARLDFERMRSDFAYTEHQLRTPLNEAMNTLNVVEGETDAKALNDAVATSEKAIRSTIEIVNSLLEVTNLERGNIVPKFRETALETVIKDTLTKLKNSNITTDLPQGLSVNTDKEIASKILEVVIKNAVDYGEGKEVKISASNERDGVLVEVSDQGMSIPEEEIGLVFTKHFRGQKAVQTLPGTGLDLYMAKSYMDLLKGKIFFDSKDGKTTFSMLFPHRLAQF